MWRPRCRERPGERVSDGAPAALACAPLLWIEGGHVLPFIPKRPPAPSLIYAQRRARAAEPPAHHIRTAAPPLNAFGCATWPTSRRCAGFCWRQAVLTIINGVPICVVQLVERGTQAHHS